MLRSETTNVVSETGTIHIGWVLGFTAAYMLLWGLYLNSRANGAEEAVAESKLVDVDLLGNQARFMLENHLYRSRMEQRFLLKCARFADRYRDSISTSEWVREYLFDAEGLYGEPSTLADPDPFFYGADTPSEIRRLDPRLQSDYAPISEAGSGDEDPGMLVWVWDNLVELCEHVQKLITG